MVGVVGARQAEAVDAPEQLRVACRHLAAPGEDPLQLLELPDPDGRTNVVDAVVEPEPGVIEPTPPSALPWLRRPLQEPPRLLRPRGHDTTLTGRDLLVRIERPDGVLPLGAERPTLVDGASASQES